MKLSIATATLLFTAVSADYLALRGQKGPAGRRAAVEPFEFADEEDVPVPDVYTRSEEFGLMEMAAEGEDPEDDGTTDGGIGDNEPGYKEGLEPPDEDEDGSDYQPGPCEELGEDPDPESQAYVDCMAASDEGEEEEGTEEEAVSMTTESYSAQQGQLELPSESQVVTKTVTLEYTDGTTATVTETYPASN